MLLGYASDESLGKAVSPFTYTGLITYLSRLFDSGIGIGKACIKTGLNWLPVDRGG